MQEYRYYQIIPEDIVEKTAKSVGGENSFTRLLSAAKEYKEANLEPIYLLDPYTMDVIVVIKETFQKKLH
jgi:hypothetical protein